MYEKRITEITVVPEGEPLFSEDATKIRIHGEHAGEFVTVQQCPDDPEPGTVNIDPAEWPVVRKAINEMVNNCKGE